MSADVEVEALEELPHAENDKQQDIQPANEDLSYDDDYQIFVLNLLIEEQFKEIEKVINLL